MALFSILGVALTLVGGSLVSLGGIFTTDVILAIVVLVGVPVTVGAFLLCFAFRAWWVAVFAGVAWIVGEFLAAVVRPLVEGGWPGLQAQEYFWGGQGVSILWMVGPLIFSMALGAAGALTLVSLGKRGVSPQ